MTYTKEEIAKWALADHFSQFPSTGREVGALRVLLKTAIETNLIPKEIDLDSTTGIMMLLKMAKMASTYKDVGVPEELKNV